MRLQVTSRGSLKGKVTTSLWWEAAGERQLLSAADYRGLSLREKVYAMREVNLHVASVTDAEQVGSGDGVGAPLLARR